MSDAKPEERKPLPKPTVKVLRTGGEIDGLLTFSLPHKLT